MGEFLVSRQIGIDLVLIQKPKWLENEQSLFAFLPFTKWILYINKVFDSLLKPHTRAHTHTRWTYVIETSRTFGWRSKKKKRDGNRLCRNNILQIFHYFDFVSCMCSWATLCMCVCAGAIFNFRPSMSIFIILFRMPIIFFRLRGQYVTDTLTRKM